MVNAIILLIKNLTGTYDMPLIHLESIATQKSDGLRYLKQHVL
jgi:hypothetical protein